MGALLDRVSGLIRRSGDLAPLKARVEARHLAGHRDMIARGETPDGAAVAPLAASTLKGRRGGGPPRAPRGVNSRVVTRCEVTATVGPDRSLRVVKRFPGFSVARYLHDGTRNMPARPMGFRPQDREQDRADLRRYILEGDR